MGTVRAPPFADSTQSGAAAARQESTGSLRAGPVEIAMKNVNYRIERDIVLQVRQLRGRLTPTVRDVPVTFYDRNSFLLSIDSAEVAITASSFSKLLNSYIFAYPGAPLKNLSVAVLGNRIKQTGTMHKGIDLLFEIQGTLSATPDGAIRLHADNIKSVHILFKGLLHLFGEDLSSL